MGGVVRRLHPGLHSGRPLARPPDRARRRHQFRPLPAAGHRIHLRRRQRRDLRRRPRRGFQAEQVVRPPGHRRSRRHRRDRHRLRLDPVTAASRAVVALALAAAPVAAQAPGLPVHGGGFRRGRSWSRRSAGPARIQLYGRRDNLRGTVAYGSGQLGRGRDARDAEPRHRWLGHDAGDAGLWCALLGEWSRLPVRVGGLRGRGYPVCGSCAYDVGRRGCRRLRRGWRLAHPSRRRRWRSRITTPFASIRPWLAPRAEIFRGAGRCEENTTTKSGRLGGCRSPIRRGPRRCGCCGTRSKATTPTLGVGLSYRF